MDGTDLWQHFENAEAPKTLCTVLTPASGHPSSRSRYLKLICAKRMVLLRAQCRMKRLLTVLFNGYGFALRFEGPHEFRICEVIEPWSSRERKSLIFTGSHAPNREAPILVCRPFHKGR